MLKRNKKLRNYERSIQNHVLINPSLWYHLQEKALRRNSLTPKRNSFTLTTNQWILYQTSRTNWTLSLDCKQDSALNSCMNKHCYNRMIEFTNKHVFQNLHTSVAFCVLNCHFSIYFTIADRGGNLLFSLTNVVLTKQIPFTSILLLSLLETKPLLFH